MANYHTDLSIISRGQGLSLGQRVAYDGGLNFYDEYVGMTWYNPRKDDDVISRQIILVPNAPSEYRDLQTFVRAIDQAEKRQDAQTAKELVFSLPVELSRNKQIELAYRSIEEFWVSRGMCSLVCIHDNGTGNPHTHAILTTRAVDYNGFSKTKNRDWNKKELLLQWRQFWANAQNLALERNGCEARVSHLSYEVRGLKDTPTKNLGPKASALERDGISTDRGDENRAILAERERKLEAKREQEARKVRKKRRRCGRTY